MQRALSLALATLCSLMVLFGPRGAAAGEIGWIEDFSLAGDRGVPLKQLIPGTEDYYYYHCLHYQNTEQWPKVEETLKAWVDRYNWTARALEIQNRQALLTYSQNPARALELIRSRLNLQFDHQREQLNEKPNLPTKLDPAFLTLERLNRQAFAYFPNSLQGFTDAALDRLVTEELTPDLRRQLLSRLQRPDFAILPKLVVDDLNHEHSGGFGQFEIHRRLLLAQLEECLKLKPDLRNQTNFVQAYLWRLQPSNDVNWRQDRDALAAYLDRLWAFVKTLDLAHNSLKAHVLYQRLVLDRSLGHYDAAVFLEYLKLPRQAPYVRPELLQRVTDGAHFVNLQRDFAGVTLLPVIGDDEPLVRSYLAHFLLDAADTKVYAPYIEDQYLKQLFAETKIVNGLGDAQRWYSLLPPEKYQQLKQRIDLDFAFTNKTELAPEDPVSLDLYVKNVETLIVKVFEINTQNFYREHRKQIGPDINLDGLVANEEKTYTYQEPALRRVRRHFEFPKLDRRGVFVIDFIGNGMASRALIHKGALHYLVRNSTVGQIFTVFDEQNRLVPDATLWLGGNLYSASKDGTIATPYSNAPTRQPIVLTAGGFSSLETLQQSSESYRLAAAMFVDREELIARRKAQLVVRPQLLLGGTPVSRKVLEEVRLEIISTDLDNVSTTKEVADFKLHEDRETTYEFQVPQRLAQLKFVLRARVQNHSQNQKVQLAAEETFGLNEIDRTDKTECLHFAQVGNDYQLELLGKTGEARPHRAVQITLRLRDYAQPAIVALQTDAAGRIALGPLPGVVEVSAVSPQGTTQTWPIRHAEHTYPASLNADTEQPIELPYMGTRKQPDREELSLLELRADHFAIDRFASLSIADGLLKISKLPPGDYSLLFKTTGVSVRLQVTTGPRRAGYVLGDYRKLELRNARPLQMLPIEVTDKKIRVRLQNVTPQTRVHVFATRFEPAYPAYANLARIVPAEPYSLSVPQIESQYLAGRNIGDEYRYIIDRKFAAKFPGNMLERPSLLLNPWAVRSTQTGDQRAEQGEAFGDGRAMLGAHGGSAPQKPLGVIAQGDFADLDFLAHSSEVAANLVPDDKGLIELDRADLGPHQQLLFVGVDPQNTVSRRVALPEAASEYLDLRLAKSLDLQQHFTQQQQVSLLATGDQLVVNDITSSRFEVYDSVARVYGLYTTLNRDAKLAEFSFVRNWSSLKDDEKRSLYHKYASHELHLFLYKKDPDFFKQAVRPYLANKKEKQFLDRWLLDDNLADELKPWKFEQLNTLERVLIGQRVAAQRAEIRRLVRHQFELLPPNADRISQLFRTAIKGSALDTVDALGLRDAQDANEQEKLLSEDKSVDMAMPLGGMAGPVVNAPAAPPAPAAEPEAPAEAAAFAAKPRSSDRKSAGKQKAGRLKEAAKDQSRAGEKAEEADFFDDDVARHPALQQLYRQLDKTMEWAESNYYKLPLEEQTPALVSVNAFWRDVAAHDPAQPLLSANLAEPTHTFAEMLAALALVDLPFKAGEHKTAFEGLHMTFTAGGPAIVYHEEIQPASKVAENTPILVSQNFFRAGDRYRQVAGEQVDKFVSEEFLTSAVYGCQIVVTNPSSARKKVDVLLQIPAGALPVSTGQNTRSVHLDLGAYHTQTLDYYFYFPRAGKFAHYPVQVASGSEVLAFAAPFVLNVVDELTNIDKESWDYISQHGSPQDVLDFLAEQNLLRVDLGRIAWRMQDKAFFGKVIKLLGERHLYNHVLWSYSVKHDDAPAIRQFLQFASDFVNQCGAWIDSPLLVIDPVVRKTYEQLDYKPLVNARSGQLGRTREILNDRFLAQYQRLLRILAYRPQLDHEERMVVIYYLLLQDRVADALPLFERVDRDALSTHLQYDYFAAYLDFSKSQPDQARQIAAQYADYPIQRWREAFASIVSQANEIDAPIATVVDSQDRTQVQTGQAARAPSFEFTVEGQQVKLAYQNLDEVQVNYYLMDIELLFSRNPFVQGDSRQFSSILPNATQTLKLPEKESSLVFPLPKQLTNTNVLVEIVGAGQTQSRAYYSTALAVQVTENSGQLRVTVGAKGLAQPKVYVKVYARMNDGSVRFYKDGYTDLRGRFDYTSLNTDELSAVQRFALLILSEEQGAVVREAAPPIR